MIGAKIVLILTLLTIASDANMHAQETTPCMGLAGDARTHCLRSERTSTPSDRRLRIARLDSITTNACKAVTILGNTVQLAQVRGDVSPTKP
ncbi:MAG: hypothetical protein ACRELE_10280, partial [Gemmatimonadales bacterium]